jgi:hypothetical protein
LYNLSEDVPESQNLAERMPDKAADLRRRLRAWRQSVDAAMPKPNPDFKGRN